MSHKMKKLLKGHTTQLHGEDIVDAVHHFPNMSQKNYNKLLKSYNKGNGCRLCLNDEELSGSGIVKEAKKVGKFIAKSGISDVIIDEAVGITPLPQTAKNLISKGIKYEAKKMLGGTVNPYLPQQITGSGFGDRNIKTYNDSSNIVHVDSDAYNPSIYNLPMYSNAIAQSLFKDKKGAGFKVNM
jgi:hypothetical protein